MTDGPRTGRFGDQRGGKVVFLAHCLLNENTRYLGGAGRPGAVAEIVQPCLARGIGIVQLPCPEEQAWGGVLKRRLLAFYGAERSWAFRLRTLTLPVMLSYTRWVYRRLARRIANQIEDYTSSGVTVLGVVGVDASPSCGVRTTVNPAQAFVQIGRLPHGATGADVTAIVRDNVVPGRGLFVALLQEELTRRAVQVPFSAHDLIAELENRPAVSPVETLVSE